MAQRCLRITDNGSNHTVKAGAVAPPCAESDLHTLSFSFVHRVAAYNYEYPNCIPATQVGGKLWYTLPNEITGSDPNIFRYLDKDTLSFQAVE